MKLKRLFWFVLVLTVFLLPLASQVISGTPASTETGIFAPFVSRLEGELKNNLIRLSWVDSQDVRGPVYVYRSTVPFVEEGLQPEARLVEIPYGAQSYVDELEAGTGAVLFYFAVASDEAGRRYDIPIIYTNTISIRIPASGASGFSVETPHQTWQAEPGISSGRLPGISSLVAAVQGDRVVITFSEVSPAESSETSGAVLYRSIQPIRQTPDLLGSVIVQTKISSPFPDYPAPGIPYYYAVITEEDLIRGSVEIVPGRNATLSPVEVSLVPGSLERDIRAIPLPQISVQGAISSLGDYAETPPPRQLSPEAAKALGHLARPAAEAGLKTPRVFARDMTATPAESEEYALSSIVKGPFASRNWEAARDELVRFLALPRSPEAKSRARFYLGQSRYFLRQPREGLFEFLAIQDRYPNEAREWIQASLGMLKDTR